MGITFLLFEIWPLMTENLSFKDVHRGSTMLVSHLNKIPNLRNLLLCEWRLFNINLLDLLMKRQRMVLKFRCQSWSLKYSWSHMVAGKAVMSVLHHYLLPPFISRHQSIVVLQLRSPMCHQETGKQKDQSKESVAGLKVGQGPNLEQHQR